MKKILLGISFVLFGIACLLITLIGGYRIIDLLGVLCSIMGLFLSLIGFYEQR